MTDQETIAMLKDQISSRDVTIKMAIDTMTRQGEKIANMKRAIGEAIEKMQEAKYQE